MANNEASNLVENALNEATTKLEGYEDGDILVEWIVVCFVANPDREKGNVYPMLYSNGELPTYRAKGLLVSGLDQLRLDGLMSSD